MVVGLCVVDVAVLLLFVVLCLLLHDDCRCVCCLLFVVCRLMCAVVCWLSSLVTLLRADV